MIACKLVPRLDTNIPILKLLEVMVLLGPIACVDGIEGIGVKNESADPTLDQ
jgi:hypothetical protein